MEEAILAKLDQLLEMVAELKNQKPQKEGESKVESLLELQTKCRDEEIEELIELKENNIILSRPKGMSIGEATYLFYEWYDYKRDMSIAEAACGGEKELEHLEMLSDHDFIKLWQKWLTMNTNKEVAL